MEAPLILVKYVVLRFQYLPLNYERNLVVFIVFCLHITTLPMLQESVVAESKRVCAFGITAESDGLVLGTSAISIWTKYHFGAVN
jgi:hypothetical protein